MKVYHLAALINNRGDVSALCAKRPRKINLKRGETWTTRLEAVTCTKCLAILEAKGAVIVSENGPDNPRRGDHE